MNSAKVAWFKQGYAEWIGKARPLLDQSNWKEAFATFPALVNEDVPFTRLAKPLRESRVAVLSTAGLYLRDSQPPFDSANVEGDATFRELPVDADPAALAIAHDHYPHAAAEADLGAVYPVALLKRLMEEGQIGELAPLVISTSGYCPPLHTIVERTAPTVVAALAAQRADVLLQIPV